MTDIIRADYRNPVHAEAVVMMMQAYASDLMGGGQALPEAVLAVLPERLAAFPGAISLLAFADGQVVGLMNAFEGFSTFAARPLINVHDVVVLSEYRGRGIARALFAEIEAIAKSKDGCKLTLEVLEGNTTAQKLYTSLGFGDYVLDPAAGRALFWQKKL